MEGLSRRRRLYSVLQRRLPRRGRLRPASPRRGHATDTAHHLEAPVRAPELLRARLEGRKLQQRRRLRLHSGPGLFASQHHQAHYVLRRDDALLLGGPSGHQHERQRRRRRPTRGSRVELPEAVDSTHGALSCERRLADRPADLPLDAGQGARHYRFQIAQEPTFAAPTRGRHDRGDLVHTSRDPSGRHDALLACPCRRREPDRAQLVGSAHVPAQAAGTDAVSGQRDD